MVKLVPWSVQATMSVLAGSSTRSNSLERNAGTARVLIAWRPSKSVNEAKLVVFLLEV
jgi:hypothetical protein